MIESPNQALRELITFRVEEQFYSVDIMSVREIRGWTPATPLPQSPAFVRGVINLRGTVLPIVDMAARLGLQDAEPTQRHVIIVVWIHGRLVGLLVDAVCDIITVDEDALQPTPDVACEGIQGFVQGLLTVDERLVSLIDLDHVLPPVEAATEAA
ncbi:MAG TPA: chemotaxis protein CheW [Caulobacteraceae bacterium]|nr:chemotaxis protein CheW [Caulobacteraceae bacterium]